MGKTEQGAVWLDSKRTSPFDLYQFFRNTEDSDVAKLLRYFTDLDMEEVLKLSDLEGEEINTAKGILAFEVCKLVHGEEEASKARDTALSLLLSTAAVLRLAIVLP